MIQITSQLRSDSQYLVRGFMVCFLAIVVSVAGFVGRTAASDEVDPELENALLEEDWSKASGFLTSISSETPSPVLRMIKGHAGLALNRNNESLALFLGATAPDDLAAWQAYAEDFKKRNPGAPIADYFVGDSLARVGKYDQAIHALDVGLSVNPRHVLSLNSRGVSLALLGKSSEASSTLGEAVMLSKSKFADALVNKGMFRVQTSDAPEDARISFSLAKDLTDQNAVALHGLALLALVSREYDKALELNDQACMSAKSLAEIFLINEERYTQTIVSTLADSGAGEGTTLTRNFERLSLNVDNYNSVAGRNDFMGNARANLRAIPIARELTRMSDSDLAKFAKDHPEQIGGAMDAVRRELKSTERNRSITGAAGNYFQWSGLVSSGAALSPDPVVGNAGKASALASGVASATFKGLEYNNKQYEMRLNTTFKELGKGMNRSIQRDISAGKYRPTYSPDQTEAGRARIATERMQSGIQSNQYPRAGGPDPSRLKWDRPGTRMDRHPGTGVGGANTSFSAVQWDDGNWPFIPIYGLAYGMAGYHQGDQPARITTDDKARGTADGTK